MMDALGCVWIRAHEIYCVSLGCGLHPDFFGLGRIMSLEVRWMAGRRGVKVQGGDICKVQGGVVAEMWKFGICGCGKIAGAVG